MYQRIREKVRFSARSTSDKIRAIGLRRPMWVKTLWGLLPRTVLLFSILLVVSTVIVAWRDLRQKPGAKAPAQPHSSGLALYQVTLDSIDVDTQIVRARAQVLFSAVPVKPKDAEVTSYPQTFYCQPNEPFSVNLSHPIVFVGYGGRPQFGDLGRSYSQNGLRWIQDVEPLGPCDPNQPNSGFVQSSVPVQAELYAVGDPRSFPFDRYLVIYRMWIPVLVQKPDGGYVGILGFNEVDSKLTGFRMRYPSPREVELWSAPVLADPKQQPVGYKEQMWAGRQMAVTLERGLFIRAITIFLAAVLFAYLFRFAIAGPKKETWFPDTLGFFLTVWAVRSALSVGGPHAATLIDYGALCFYVCFIGIFLCKVARNTKSGQV